jgi:hypothetical protein
MKTKDRGKRSRGLRGLWIGRQCAGQPPLTPPWHGRLVIDEEDLLSHRVFLRAVQRGRAFRVPPAVRKPSNFTLHVIDSFLWILERLAGSCGIGCTVYDLMCYTSRPN